MPSLVLRNGFVAVFTSLMLVFIASFLVFVAADPMPQFGVTNLTLATMDTDNGKHAPAPDMDNSEEDGDDVQGICQIKCDYNTSTAVHVCEGVEVGATIPLHLGDLCNATAVSHPDGTFER